MRIVIGALGLVMFGTSGALLAQQRYIPAEIEAGGRLFTSSCTGCHGPEGDWVGGVNFSKGQFRRSTSDDDLVRVIMRGIPNTPMPPSNFSDGQAATIVAYVRSLANGGGASRTGCATARAAIAQRSTARALEGRRPGPEHRRRDAERLGWLLPLVRHEVRVGHSQAQLCFRVIG